MLLWNDLTVGWKSAHRFGFIMLNWEHFFWKELDFVKGF